MINKNILCAALCCAALYSCTQKFPLEKEPNDSFSQATLFDAGRAVQGNLSSPSDRDIFVTEIAEGAPFDITLSPVKGVNVALKIWQANAEPQLIKLIDDARKSSGERFKNIYLSPGKYFFEVTHGDRDTAKGEPEIRYTLSVMPHDAPGTEEREPNDDRDHANTIIVGENVKGYYSPGFNKLNLNTETLSREEDWYTFRAEQADEVSKLIDIKITGVTGVRSSIRLYDQNFILTGSAESASPGEPVELQRKTIPGTGTYYLAVSSAAFESNNDDPYELAVTLGDFDASREVEPNDAFDKATVFAGETMTGHILPAGDHDIYVFSADSPSLVSVKLLPPASLDGIIRIYSRNFEKLCEAQSGGDGTPEKIPSFYCDNKLYIDVSAAPGKQDAKNTYAFSISSEPYRNDAEREPNDSKSRATRIKGNRITGYLTYKKDKDYFLYEAPARAVYTVTVQGIPDAAFTVSVTDPNGYIIRTEKIAGEKKHSFRETFDGKTYIIVESQKENPESPYSISMGK